jgi:hypothetical protein
MLYYDYVQGCFAKINHETNAIFQKQQFPELQSEIVRFLGINQPKKFDIFDYLLINAIGFLFF